MGVAFFSSIYRTIKSANGCSGVVWLFQSSAVCGYVTGTGVAVVSAGTGGVLFVIQYLSCYLAGLIQRVFRTRNWMINFFTCFLSSGYGSSDCSWMVFYERILLTADYRMILKRILS